MADTPTPAYSLRLRVRMENRPGMLGRLAMAIGEVGANIAALDGFEVKTSHLVQNAVVYCKSCLLYTSPSPRDRTRSRMPSSA